MFLKSLMHSNIESSVFPHYDVVIIGGGPAGSAASITLAKAGWRVLLIDSLIEKQDAGKGQEEFRVGEGLPPAARSLLGELGVMERFLADRHLPSYGNESAWGSRVLQSSDFIRDPHGYGWRLDRPRFDSMLREAAQDAGSLIQEGARITDLGQTQTGAWRLKLTMNGGQAEAGSQWLVDCTGQRSWLARRLGIRRIHYDRLMGFGALFSPSLPILKADRDSLTLVESSPHGWWYTALLPTRRRVVVFLTDADTPAGRSAYAPEGYTSLLQQTEHICRRLAAYGYKMEGVPWATSARSSRLEQFSGSSWLAAGDAAASYDPLSSQGIFTALYSGLKAGLTLQASQSGDTQALVRYGRDMTAIYDIYLQNRVAFYGYERRWPTSEFWLRRNASCTTTSMPSVQRSGPCQSGAGTAPVMFLGASRDS